LLGGTFHRAIRTKHTAIAGFRLEAGAAQSAGIRVQGLFFLKFNLKNPGTTTMRPTWCVVTLSSRDTGTTSTYLYIWRSFLMTTLNSIVSY